jgi:HD-GYP domain-containing protein (c-di-GMP phosphodiesterase class II)
MPTGDIAGQGSSVTSGGSCGHSLKYQGDQKMSNEQQPTDFQRRASLLESHVGFKLDHVLDHALAARDSYTQEHSRRVVALSEAIGAHLQLTEHEMDVLSLTAGFHDIGKLGIPDRILLKTGRLSLQEYEDIKAHPVIGANMLRSLAHPLLDEVAECVLRHHEHWDGSGYPDGIAGSEIPVLSCIVAVVDAYDAITTRRSYRQPLESDHALALIASSSGSQFCPKAVAALQAVLSWD